MTTRKRQIEAARLKGIRLTVSIVVLVVLAIYLYVIFRRW